MTTAADRWNRALTDLSSFHGYNADERKSLYNDIEHLANGPLSGYEGRICSELHDLTSRFRNLNSHAKENAIKAIRDLGDLVELLGRRLLIFDEQCALSLTQLFVDFLPLPQNFDLESQIPIATSMLNGLAAVLYQNGIHIPTVTPLGKHLQDLFVHCLNPQLNPNIRCALAQSCVNIALPSTTGHDPEREAVSWSLNILLKLLDMEGVSEGDKCITTAHMIMVAIKGVSRILERKSSRNEYIHANELNTLLTQGLNWSLYGLQGAQPMDKTIKREELPEDLIPDERSADHQRVKRKKAITRRKFRPAENDVPNTDMEEIKNRLPWLGVSSSSDSESDTNTEKDAESRKLRQKRSCIRQAALITLKIIVKNTGKRDLCHYWKLFLPSSIQNPENIVEEDLNQGNCGLIVSILWDPAPKARNLAVEVLRHFIHQCKQFIQRCCVTRRSGQNYTSLGEALTVSIERLHHLLIFALQKEQRMNFHCNQEILLMNQLYNTLKIASEATNYSVFRINLLKTVVTKVLPLSRIAAQFMFLKSIAGEKTLSNNCKGLYGVSWDEITAGEHISYYICNSLREAPWPIATAYSLLWNSYGKDAPSVISDPKMRTTIEEEAIEILQNFATHHFHLLKEHHEHFFDILKILFNSEIPPNNTAAAFRLLQTINAQSKTWRVTHNTPPEQDTPVPIVAFHEIWSFLIESILPKYLQTTTTVDALIAEAALEAVSHIEGEVFPHLNNRQQAWIMSVMPDMCNHSDIEVQTRAIKALGDLVLIQAMRSDENFLNSVTNVLLKKTIEHKDLIFTSNPHDLSSKVRNDLIYAIACLADAMRLTMEERSLEDTNELPFVYEIFSEAEIKCFFDLMNLSKDFYDHISAQDRVKPQALRAVGGFLQLAPAETPKCTVSRLVKVLESAIRQKNAKVVWNGSKAAEYFFSNEFISVENAEWSHSLIKALSFSVTSHQNNKVKINCLATLKTPNALKIIRNDPASQDQLLKDLEHLSANFQKIESTGVDYRSKMRDMVIEMIAELASADQCSVELNSLVKTRTQTFALPFQDYVDTNGLDSLDKLLKSYKANRNVLDPITSILVEKDNNANEVVFDADSIPAVSPYAGWRAQD